MSYTLTQDQIDDSDTMAAGADIPNFSKAGTGKTLVTMEAIRKTGAQRGLILGPMVSLTMWKEELESWLGCTAQILHGQNKVIKENPDFVITTYDTATRSILPYLYKHFDGGVLVNDESQYLRTHTSKRSQAVFGRDHDGDGGLMEKFDQVWNLSGNPIMRHSDDLWAQIRPLHPAVMQKYHSLDYDEYVANFCVRQRRQYNPRMAPVMAIVASRNEVMLNRMLYEDIGAVRRLEAPDLPPLRERVMSMPITGLSPKWGKLISKMTHEQVIMMLSADGDDDNDLQKAWQAVSLAKVKTLSEYIADSSLNGPVLVGVWNSNVREAYLEELRERHGKVFRTVHGGTSRAARDKIKDEFNEGSIDGIVGQMAAMGVSWNLQKSSSHVVIAQTHYSPGVIEQFYKRVFRYGQKNPVQLDHALGDHPVDLAIYKLMRQKEGSAEKVLD